MIFEPNLGFGAENSLIFFFLNSLIGFKISYFSLKVGGSKVLNYAATGDQKSDRRGVKRGS